MKLLASVFGLFLFSATAQAHLFLEPDIGFEFGKAKQSFVSTNVPTVSSDSNQNGTTYGVAGGYRYQRYFLGGQIEKGLAGHVTDINAFAGLNIAIRVRVLFGYIFSSKDEISSGSGYKVGIGVALSNVFSINGEYVSRTYNKYTGPAAYTGLVYSGTTNTFKITLSIPLPRPL